MALLALIFVPRAFPQTAGPEPAPASQSGPSSAARQEASGGEDETAQFKHSFSLELLAKLTRLSPESAYWLAVVANFAIIIGVFAWISKKHLPAVFRGRTVSIQKSLEEARQASEDANRRLSEIESRLARLDGEISQMRATMEKEAAAEEARIRAAADEEARRIVQSAEQEIAVAARSARRELTEYAADLAVSLATKQIRIDGATDQVLVRRFLHQLSSDGRSGKA
jgi:F-type H+-transporting ATPase subunit b